MRGLSKVTIVGIFSILSVMSLLVGMETVESIGSGQVELQGPPNATWFNASNYTAGFKANWSNMDNTTMNVSNCTLFLGTLTSPAGFDHDSDFQTLVTDTNVTGWNVSSHYAINTTLYFDVLTPRNVSTETSYVDSAAALNHTFYWTIRCRSESAVPKGWWPESRTMYFDSEVPQYKNVVTSFTNNTWLARLDQTFLMNVSDSYPIFANYKYTIVNKTGGAATGGPSASLSYTKNVADITNVNLTPTFLNLNNYTIEFQITDSAANSNTSIETYVLKFDTTAPVVTWLSSATANGTTRAGGDVLLNFSIAETNLKTWNTTVSVGGTIFNTTGWTAWDNSESIGSGGPLAYDELWTTNVSSDNDSIVLLYENYTDTTNTDLRNVTKIEYMFKYNLTYNVTFPTASINVSFYNYTSEAWVNVYSNNTATNTSGAINYTISVTTLDEYINYTYQYNTTITVCPGLPLQIRVNLTDGGSNRNQTIQFYEGQARFYYERCVYNTSGGITFCDYNATGLSAVATTYFQVNETYDEANSRGSSTWRSVKVDVGDSPTLAVVYNFTVKDSALVWKLNITDTNPGYCQAYIINSTRAISSTSIGAFTGGISGTSNNCNGTIAAATIRPLDATYYGQFILQFNASDTQRTAVTNSNKTGVITKLYTGWNLVTWLDHNATQFNLHEICERVRYCTGVSYHDNTAGSYTTYSASVVSTNNFTTALNHGDAIYIYVSEDDYLIQNDWTPGSGQPYENITIGGNTSIWTTFGILYNSTLNTTLHALRYNATYTSEFNIRLMNINFTSWVNTTSEVYNTCYRANELCTPMNYSKNPTNIVLQRGQAIWVAADASAIINRTRIAI